jgi:hypothetical protein
LVAKAEESVDPDLSQTDTEIGYPPPDLPIWDTKPVEKIGKDRVLPRLPRPLA